MDSISEKQSSFIRIICSKILSHPFTQTDVCLYLGDHDFINDDIKLIQEIFQRKNIKIIFRPKKFYVDYNNETAKNVLLICKEWFQPLVGYLKILDDKKRSDWSANYDQLFSLRTEKQLQNHLIDNVKIDGFDYLVNYEWDVVEGLSNYGKGDLIFGSDYGIYLVVETKWLNESTGATARTARKKAKNKVKDQAKKYKELARKKFRNVKIIGASFTNEEYNKLQFVSSQDKDIAQMILKNYI